jgi:ATP-dependent helicase/nuclease subunit A
VLDPSRSVSLRASAGSGKTWQLISRVVRMLLDGAEPGGILALTFTRKAAVEMRLRLNERLRRLADADEAGLDAELVRVGLAPTAALRARARGLYRQMLFAAHPPRAMTLHAFCQELLERFALDAQVPPGFALEENEEDLIDRSWRRLQAQLTAAPDSAPAHALRNWSPSASTSTRCASWWRCSWRAAATGGPTSRTGPTRRPGRRRSWPGSSARATSTARWPTPTAPRSRRACACC